MKNAKNIAIYRQEADGTLTNLGGTKSGSYITFTTDHFSNYIIKATYECDETGNHVDENCDKLCDVCDVEYATLGHKYTSVVTSATCVNKGYTTYTCSKCGDSYRADETVAKGHKLGSYSVVKAPGCTESGTEKAQCINCSYSETRIIEADGHNYKDGVCTRCGADNTKNCSCNCHKGGISGFFFKLILFFQKIFKTNKVCACGKAHY